MTKTEATAKGKKLLKMMKGKRWKLRVWENIGWHYSVRCGPLRVLPSRDNKKFHCLMANDMEGGFGSGIWTIHYRCKDPNRAVARQVGVARRVVDDLNKVVSFAEDAIKVTR